ncbi:MAG: dockerin type I domain-containing protein [Xenococcaceae cyanobacterium]
MVNINLSSLDGITGFLIPGLEQDSRLGDAVSSAGDINGDGIADIIIGAKDADVNGNNSTGKIYVIFGKNSDFSSSFNLANLDGSNGFVLNGIDAEDLAGISVSNAGDINNDGVEDLIIGARGGDPNGNSNAGESYVVFGQDSGFNASFNLANLDGSNGFVINGINSGDFSGTSVSGAGDVNGDSIDDLIIGANFADSNAGESYIVFGQDSGFNASFNLANLDGSNGFVINGINSGDFSGTSVSGAGDINGDGVSDLIIGANFADPNGNSNAGESYVVFGNKNGFTSNLNLANLDGSNGFVINGINSGDFSGTSVSSAGDINGDGFSDLIVGATNADPNNQENAGQAYVILGTDAEFNSSFDLSSLNGQNGFVINGTSVDNLLGTSVSSAGDFNGDRLDDIIISAVGANQETGTSYVLFGSAEPFNAVVDLDQLEPNQGFTIGGIDQGDRSGNSVSGAGDVNGDGFDDLIIGAPQADPNDIRDAGESYLVFGRGNLLGDVDGDLLYTGKDVNAISRFVVGLDSEFSAFPDIDPLLVADMNRDGAISSLDAALVAALVEDL